MQKFKLPEHKVIRYVRKNDKPIGVLVGVKTKEGKVAVNYSLLNPKDNKQFNKNLACHIAIERANNGTNTTLPHVFRKEIEHFNARVIKYFHTTELDTWM